MSPGIAFERPGTHITRIGGMVETDQKVIRDHLKVQALIRAYQVIMKLLGLV